MHTLLYVLLVIFLAGCKPHQPAEQREKSRPSSIPEIRKTSSIAKPLPLATLKTATSDKDNNSRYGNPDSYRVKDATYNVMRSAKGYKRQGIASWYGTDFHKKRTSSGEKYDMYAMTAAHKTLPLPSYVKVKNLENGHEVTVKVNDRGPFHGKRIIDLSYAAAAKLGMLKKGTASVEIETIKTKEGEANYYIQAGAFSTKQRAEGFLNQLKKFTVSTFYIEPYDNRYLVKAGPFTDMEMTTKLQTILKQNGIAGSFTMLN